LTIKQLGTLHIRREKTFRSRLRIEVRHW